GPAVLPDLAGEELHHFGGRRDRISGEELAAGEDGRRGAHVVAVGEQKAGGRCARGPIDAARLLERMLVRIRLAERERSLVGGGDLGMLFGELPVDAAEERLARDAEPAGAGAADHQVLGLVDSWQPSGPLPD